MKFRRKRLSSIIASMLSLVLIISFCASVYFYRDYYKRGCKKAYSFAKAYWWVYKGDKAFKKAQLQSAIYYYEKGVKYYPNHYRALYNLANIYVVYEDYYSALKNYEKALAIRPDYEVARIDYAIILSQIYKTDEAIEQYKKVLEYEPKYIKIPFITDNKKSYDYNRGVAYYNMGLAYRTKSLLAGLNKKTSREYLNKAQESYSEAASILNSYNSNYNLGLIHQLLGNQNQAQYYYCRAIQISPLEYEAHFNYAILLNDMKEYQNARKEFQRAGLLIGSMGDSDKIKYIYGLLSDVNIKIALSTDKDDYKKNHWDEPDEKPIYKAGKLVIYPEKKEKDSELSLKKSFSACSGLENIDKKDKK